MPFQQGGKHPSCPEGIVSNRFIAAGSRTPSVGIIQVAVGAGVVGEGLGVNVSVGGVVAVGVCVEVGVGVLGFTLEIEGKVSTVSGCEPLVIDSRPEHPDSRMHVIIMAQT